jgi:tetratricopeptide (TPR) repeat protein
MGWSNDEQVLDQAFEMGQKAISINRELPETHCLLGQVYLWKREHEKAVDLHEQMLERHPNYADGFAELGSILNFSGMPQKALGLLEKAMRLDPLYPGYHLFDLGHSYFLTGRYDEAINALKRSLSSNPDFLPARIFLAAIHADLGSEKEAHAEAAEIRKRNPEIKLEVWGQRLPYKDRGLAKRVVVLLQKAGLH